MVETRAVSHRKTLVMRYSLEPRLRLDGNARAPTGTISHRLHQRARMQSRTLCHGPVDARRVP